jgi:hypothetical protein
VAGYYLILEFFQAITGLDSQVLPFAMVNDSPLLYVQTFERKRMIFYVPSIYHLPQSTLKQS